MATVENKARPRLAFVVQRCGSDIVGGSEGLCLSLAQALGDYAECHVFTTTARDYTTWADAYPPGIERLGSLTINRFPVDHVRVPERFDAISREVLAITPPRPQALEERWMREQGPVSTPLLDAIAKSRDEFDAFIFVTYLYASTYLGLPLVEDKAILIPTAHDEWPIHLGIWDAWFRKPTRYVFLTPEERAFLERRCNRTLSGSIAGMFVDPPTTLDPAAFRQRYSVLDPFVLYCGRIDESKGIGTLLEGYRRYRRGSPGTRLQLLLAGPNVAGISDEAGVRCLSVLDADSKWNALAASEAVVVPSPFESFSLACVEAMAIGKDVIVNGNTDVLRGHIHRSGGGRTFFSSTGIADLLATTVSDPALAAERGSYGRRYARAHYSRPAVIGAYLAEINRLISGADSPDLTRP
jgi:glycosyltransferase involved in cell wall biosynthesis